jgi:hypothetical protein
MGELLHLMFGAFLLKLKIGKKEAYPLLELK